MKYFYQCLLLTLLGLTIVHSLTIDTFSENSGQSATNAFCTCSVQNNTCYSNINTQFSTTVGNSRALVLVPQGIQATQPWTQGCRGQNTPDTYISDYCTLGLFLQTGCPSSGCQGQFGQGGQLALSTPARSQSQAYIIYDGGCPRNYSNINYSGLGGVDLTDQGSSDSFNILIGKVDINAFLSVQVWSGPGRGSNATFDPSTFAFSANNDGGFTRATLPFTIFSRIPGANAGADFSSVGAIVIIIYAGDSVDLQFALIETAGILNLDKQATISTDNGIQGTAEPGDVITYTLTLSYIGTGEPAGTVFLWDDPANAYFYTTRNVSFPYYSLVAGSLSANLFQVDPTIGNYTYIPATAQIVNGPNNQPQLGRVVLYLGAVSSYTAWVVTFQVRIQNSLPCCLPVCQDAGAGVNGEPFYCLANQAYFCENQDSLNLNLTVNGNQPNFNTAFVVKNCGSSTVTIPNNQGQTITVPYHTTTPVYAPSSPYTAFTSTLVATATSGSTISVPFVVANNGTRDTNASVTFTYPSTFVTVSGSTAPFTCNGAGTCTLASLSLPAASNNPYTLTFTTNPVSGCGSTPIRFNVAISPNGCTTPVTGVTGACIDVNTADNSAVSSPVNITGSVALQMTLNSTASTVAPGGTVPLSICYSNPASSAAPSTVATVTIPSGFTGSSTGSWTCAGNVCTYNVGTVPASTTACVPLPILTLTYNSAQLTCANPALRINATLSSPCGSVSASITVTPSGNTAISLVKTGPATVATGSQIQYSLTYTNNGTRLYDSVILTDTVPVNTVYSGTGWNCTGTAAGSICTVVINPATPSIPVTFTVTVISQSCADNTIVNTATAQGICTSNTAFNTAQVTSTFTTTVTGNPDLYITKRATDGNGNTITNVAVGGSVTYVLTYGNLGNRITNAVITESAVSAPFTFVGPATWTGPDSNGLRTFAITNLAPGQNGTITFVVRADATLASCVSPSVPNTASIATQAPCVETNLANNQASTTVSVSATTDLYVNFQPVTTTPVVPNVATQSLTFCYGNLGTSADTNVVMTVTLPSSLSASSGLNSGWTISGQTASVALGTVPALQAQTCRPLIVNLPSSINCTDFGYNGTVSISGNCTETNLANNVAPWFLPVTATYDLSVTKTVPAGSTFRQTNPVVVFSITYANAGGRAVFPVVLTETVPQFTTFVPGSSDPRWTPQGNGVYTINVGYVAANQPTSAAITFAVQINLPIPSAVRLITNTVYVNMTGFCPAEVNLPNNVANVTVPVVGNPDVFIQKTDFGVVLFQNATSSTSPRFQGDVVVYTLGYGNNGDSDANNVTITETVPANTFFYAASSSGGWSCADGSAASTTCTLNVGPVPIAAGNAQNVIYQTRTFAVRFGTYSPSTFPQAVRCAQAPIQNFVSIAVSSDQVDLNQGNNQANDTTPVGGLPNLRVTLTDNYLGTPRRSGENIVYTITYSNNGVREATNAVITNTVPQYTVYNGLSSSLGWVCPSGGVAGSNCTYNVGSIAPGQNTSSLSFAVTVLPGFPANLSCVTDVKFIDNSCGEADYSDNSANICTPVTGFFDLVLQKHGYCETILYNMSYSNIGSSGARDVYLKAYVPVDSSFNANKSNAAWRCEDITPGSECLLMVTNASDPFSYLPPGAGGSVAFAINPYMSSMSSTFTVDASIDGNWSGEDLDPTPDNNRVSTTVGFSGCAECNSCCPPVDTCCPDYTDVNFVFSGVLDGIKTCSS